MTEGTSAGMRQEPDGAVVLGLHGGREVRLRPLTVRENRELRGARYEIEDWAMAEIAERRELDKRASEDGAPPELRQQVRDRAREFLDEIEARNLGWLRRLVEVAGDGAELPADDEMPPWLASTVELAQLQALLISRPGESPGRQ